MSLHGRMINRRVLIGCGYRTHDYLDLDRNAPSSRACCLYFGTWTRSVEVIFPLYRI